MPLRRRQRPPRPPAVLGAEELGLGRGDDPLRVRRVDLEVDHQPARRELLRERLPAVGRDQHRRQHGVERVQPVVAQDDLVQVGVGRAARRRSRSCRRRSSASGRGSSAACRACPGGRSRAAGPGRCVRISRNVPTRRVLPVGGDRALDRRDLAAVGGDPPEAPVGRQQEVAGRRVDVERVDERRLLGEVDQPRRAVPSRARPAALVVAAAAGERARAASSARAPHHEPACASSHSASVVKPIMIPSIQYWERTAIRG